MMVRRYDVLWSAFVAMLGIVLGLGLLCIAPFAAVGAVAARTLPARLALAAVAAMWLGNQAIGFAWLGYPHTASTLAWGLALGVAALLAALVAGQTRTLAFAFIAAFATYELVVYAFGLVSGDRDGFTLASVLQVLEGNVVGLALLAVARFATQGRRRRAAADISKRT